MTTVRPTARACGVLLGLLTATSLAPAQVKYPPLPEKVDVQIRYRIRADRDERVRQFRILEAHLKKLGFERKRQPEDELDILDPTAERFEGTIASKNVFALLDDPRVMTILFRPTDFKVPDDPAQPVSVRIRIATGYLPADQQRLHRQVVAQLGRVGFREAVGYDHTRYTLVRGDLPYGNLFRLLKDLRQEPAGWFTSDTPAAELPPPLRDVLPIRAVEVLSDADLSFLAPQVVPANREKFTPEVRAVLGDMAARTKPIRVEVVTDRRLDASELDLIRSRLRTVYTRPVIDPTTQQRDLVFASLEGAVGNVVTLDFPQAADLESFAAEAGVVAVRLPRPAVETVIPRPAAVRPTPPADVLAATRLDAFHKLGYRGQGTKVVVIGTEFPDLVSWMGFKFLGKDLLTPVVYIDLTAEFSRNLVPAPPTKNATGSGTLAARAAHLAAPDAAIVLVRVDPAAFFQVFTVARFARGDTEYSEAMLSRVAELTVRAEEVKRRNATVAEEYRQAFQNLSDDERPRQRREQARRAFDLLTRDERELTAAIGRAVALQDAMRALAGCTVLVNTLVWESGFALDGLSELSQLIDTSFASEAVAGPRNRSATRPLPAIRPLWVQPASPSVGSVWGGPYLDVDGNGTMEFATQGSPIPRGEWARDLNFLATRGADGAVTPTLAAGTKVRLTIQWRETHDPTAYGGQDSIFPLSLRVFRQLDPEGKVRASDELREVARSAGRPYQVIAEPTFGVYEQILEVIVPEDGRYCVTVEGQLVFDPRLPALRRQVQVNPRLFAEFLGAGPAKGRPVFASFAARTAGVGIPGDAKAAVTVADTEKPLGTTTTGLTGGGPGVDLLPKPDLLADGTAGVAEGQGGGPGVAAGFAGGVLAALVGSGAPAADILRATGLPRGGPAVIPENWLRVVPPRQGP